MTEQEVQPIRICFVILNAYPLFNPEAEGVIGGASVYWQLCVFGRRCTGPMRKYT